MPLMDQEPSAALTAAEAPLRSVRAELCAAPVAGRLAGESLAHEVDHRYVDHGFGTVWMGFAVAGEAAAVREPAAVRSTTQRHGITVKPFWAGSRRVTSRTMPRRAP